MTRKSKREIERALEEYDDGGDGPSTVEEWVEASLQRAAREDELTFTYTVIGSDGEIVEEGDHSEQVCVSRSDAGPDLWVAEEAVPDWIDVEEDLPVRL